MAERVWRARIAPNPVPVARAGSISLLNHSQSPSEMGEYPNTGSQSSCTPNTIISRMPSQNPGIASPRNAISVATYDPRPSTA